MKWAELGKRIASAAPLVGAAVAGPAGATVGALVANVFGVEATPDKIADAITADPEARLKLLDLQQRHQIELERITLERAKVEGAADNTAALAMTERAAKLEGTAADLKGLPILGPLVLFLRGAFRPMAAYAVILLDWQVFSGAWELPPEGPVVSAFWLINLLVLGFYFGERALKNVLPLAGLYFGKKG